MRGIIKARINAPEMKDISEFTLVIATRVVAVIPNNDDCFSCQSLLYASLEELAEWTHEDGHEIYDPIFLVFSLQRADCQQLRFFHHPLICADNFHQVR